MNSALSDFQVPKFKPSREKKGLMMGSYSKEFVYSSLYLIEISCGYETCHMLIHSLLGHFCGVSGTYC